MAYLPLSTANLPYPAINPAQGSSPADYFNTVLYDGTTAAQSITGVGFQPDWTWIKSRSDTTSHWLIDAVRTVSGGGLRSDTTDTEVGTAFTSFDSDGFSLNIDGSLLGLNKNSQTYVAWNWKANGSGVSNTDGDFAVTVSANTKSGFSIVDLTDPNTGASYEVGHGLDSPPEMFFIKKTDTTSDWSVYHKDLGNDKRLVLNDTGAQSGSSSVYFGSTTPTSDVVTIGSGLSTGDDWIMYCFHSVEGFSKIGYWDNPTDGEIGGPFVYLGFQPAWIMLKAAATSSDWTSWMIYDNTRVGINYTDWSDHMLYANRAYNEGLRGNGTSASVLTTNGFQLDFLSNGFKIYGGGNAEIDSGGKYIYMAFAENPFKYSNAR